MKDVGNHLQLVNAQAFVMAEEHLLQCREDEWKTFYYMPSMSHNL